MDLITVTGWRTATHSSGNGGACIEAGNTGHGVAVRDSKDRQGPALAFTAAAWQVFTQRVKVKTDAAPA
jgi:hypothetical protein